MLNLMGTQKLVAVVQLKSELLTKQKQRDWGSSKKAEATAWIPINWELSYEKRLHIFKAANSLAITRPTLSTFTDFFLQIIITPGRGVTAKNC